MGTRQVHIFAFLALLMAVPLAALDVSSVKQGAPVRRGRGWEQRSEFAAPVKEGARLLLRADNGAVSILPAPGGTERIEGKQMIVIGEKINATRKTVAAAIDARDQDHILKLATEQVAAGANYLDLNGGNPDPRKEVANMEWLVSLVQAHTDAPLCIDSANPQAVERGLALARAKPIINSVSLEAERLKTFLPLVSKRACLVVALCMSDEGMPKGADARLERAEKLVAHLTAAGRKLDEIIIDPCFLPVSAEPDDAQAVCLAIAQMRRRWPEVHIGGGLSNVSFGLPARKLVNLAMIVACIFHGMDTAIIDPGTPMMVPLILAGEVVTGADAWCANYVGAFRAGKLG